MRVSFDALGQQGTLHLKYIMAGELVKLQKVRLSALHYEPSHQSEV